ncbi:MAG TPA: MFS transporter [Acidimicrobiales bacterium]
MSETGQGRRWGRRDTTTPRPSLANTFSSLSVPAYRRWFFSQVLSASGTMTQIVALAWLVLRLTGSGVDLGLVTTCTFAPMLLAGPWAGALVDRVNRRRLLVLTQSLYIALSLVLALVTATGVTRLWMVLVISFASGCVGAPDAAARQVYAIDLVGLDHLTSAVSLNEVVLNASRVVGPALGGLLLATEGVTACCIANAASFVPPLVVLISHGRTTPPVRVAAEDHDHFMAGLRYAWNNRTIRLTLMLAAASGMLFNLNVPLPLVATRVFHLGAGGYGLMMSVFGVGGIFGGLVAAAGHRAPTRLSVVRLAGVTGVVVMVTASARNLTEVYAGLALTGCVSIWFIARANALVQFATEPRLRGRVMAVWAMALPGLMPLTSPLVGFVGETLGARESLGVSGATLVVIAACGSLRARRCRSEILT